VDRHTHNIECKIVGLIFQRTQNLQDRNLQADSFLPSLHPYPHQDRLIMSFNDRFGIMLTRARAPHWPSEK